MRNVILIAVVAWAGCSSNGVELGGDATSADAAADALALGVDSERFLDDLTGDEHLALCEWMVAIQGGPHSIDCGGGITVTIDPVAECLQLEWPHCQVGLLADCVAAQSYDLCASSPPACAVFYECVAG